MMKRSIWVTAVAICGRGTARPRAYPTNVPVNAIRRKAGTTSGLTCREKSWYTDPIKFESSEMDVSILDIGDNYLNTIDATIIDGRDFIKDSQNDVEQSVIINETLVNAFNWDDPVGKRIVLRDTLELFVVGVVKDIYIKIRDHI